MAAPPPLQAHQRPHIHASASTERAVLLCLLLALLLVGAGAAAWRARAPRSYGLASLLALWLFPLAAALPGHWWRFLSVWTAFSLLAAVVLRRVLFERPLRPDTPGFMYAVFSGLYAAAAATAVLAYVAFMFVVVLLPARRPGGGAPPPPLSAAIADAVVAALGYSVYFGVLVRDTAEIAAEKYC